MSEPGHDATYGLSPDQAWEQLLEDFRPPHREQEWFSPVFWPLLQAAHAEPALRAVYPQTSLNTLVLFHNLDAWRYPSEEQWPGAAAWSSGMYTVLSRGTPDGESLLETADPAEAASLLARLIHEARAR